MTASTETPERLAARALDRAAANRLELVAVIAAAIREAVAAEATRNAQIADLFAAAESATSVDDARFFAGMRSAGKQIAAAIRSRRP